MKKMLTVASGFQYSVNIAYDLGSEEKIRNYIPTPNAMDFLQEILASVQPKSTDRARVLVGAYGRGKSHMVLTSLGLLMQKNLGLFNKLWQQDTQGILKNLVEDFYCHNQKLLPVIISGSNTSLTQAFILSLQRTLQDNNLMDIMPETNYHAAADCIGRWKQEYQATYRQLAELLREPVDSFVQRLRAYDIDAYRTFEEIYPKLTAGSSFNPFSGFDVVELYESVAKALRGRGYGGIYVVYDEFSKYLETDIASATVSDTKMLQDFAEKCNRSGSLQMHILLICHKEIANYIDRLPKERTDGWRGVSERFRHLRLSNSFQQTYSLISQVVIKDADMWQRFVERYQENIHQLEKSYAELLDGEEDIIKGCYPLHPVSLFLLPRLSEKIAQNERTLFTFLSAEGSFTVPGFLSSQAENDWALIMPERIFDYFQPLMQKELYSGELYQEYILVQGILAGLEEKSLEAKLVKTLGLIYMVGELDKLSPDIMTLERLYSSEYSIEAVEKALSGLIDANCLVELRRNKGFLRLKESSGVDIKAQIANQVAAQEHRIQDKDILNTMNFDGYIYPARYNETKEMTRYFRFEFIRGQEIQDNVDWDRRSQALEADGAIYGILPENQQELDRLYEKMPGISGDRVLFVLPEKYKDMHQVVQELYAVDILKKQATNDPVLYREYDLLYRDLQQVVKSFIQAYISPASHGRMYFYHGHPVKIWRKSQLSEKLSQIMFNCYGDTPAINNEAVNKNLVTKIVVNSRSKVVAGILRQHLEKDLGLRSTGQDVAIMRSTLLRTGVLVQEEGMMPRFNLATRKNPQLAAVLQGIKEILLQSTSERKITFQNVYDYLILPEHHIGMRRGLIPIYLGVVLHELGQHIAVSNTLGELSVDADLLQQINENPDRYFVERICWDESREQYLQGLAELFQDDLLGSYEQGSCRQVREAIDAWYRSLPRYSRQLGMTADGEMLPREKRKFINSFTKGYGSRELLFQVYSRIFATGEDYQALLEQIAEAKAYYEQALNKLQGFLYGKLVSLFAGNMDDRSSLTSVFRNWLEELNPMTRQQVFGDNTEVFLQLLAEEISDEKILLEKLAMLASGLRLEDWQHEDIERFLAQISKYRTTAEQHSQQANQNTLTKDNQSDVPEQIVMDKNSYELRFADKEGRVQIKRFSQAEYSSRGRRLKNTILARLEEAGQGLSQIEKRQILLEVLQEII